jgi:Na+-transporting NADH:ubiquinone oxidoreductase subunit NqrD
MWVFQKVALTSPTDVTETIKMEYVNIIYFKLSKSVHVDTFAAYNLLKYLSFFLGLLIRNQLVVGSIPTTGSNKIN